MTLRRGKYSGHDLRGGRGARHPEQVILTPWSPRSS